MPNLPEYWIPWNLNAGIPSFAQLDFAICNDPGASMNRFGPLSFSFELAPAAERVARQRKRISEREPACSTQEMAAHPTA